MYKTNTEFPRVGCRDASSCRAAPGSPRLASAVDGNWTQECTDQHLDQDCRQDKEQGPLQKPTMDEEERDPCDPPALN